ncbi:MAG: DUF58 domain-containing protein [Gammaproteobacteria bacterium]|nr:DUF58 domain-containing protein [Gammaproteobacteria bacterium]
MWLARDNAAPVAGARFIEPRVLARIASMELVAKTVVDGFISGLHRAPYLGLSVEFAEHRAYMPGDDIRRIDWRVYGRTDRLYVKEFQAETNASVTLLLDVSRSMDYGPAGVTKLDYARCLVASLGYLSLTQRDRVGLVTFSEDLETIRPPSGRHFDRILHTLETVHAGKAGELIGPLGKVGQLLSRRGILALVSDLYVDAQALTDAVAELRHRGNDVMVFHVLDPSELELPAASTRQFIDMESGERMPVATEQIRPRYAEAVRAHIERLGALLGEQDVDYAFFDTSMALDHALFRYLSARQRRARVR